MTSALKTSFVVINRNVTQESSSPHLLSEETSNESEWAIFANRRTTPTEDVLSSISSSNILDEEDDILQEVIINQSVIRVEQWLRMGFSHPMIPTPNLIGISILKRVLKDLKPREGLIKSCNIEYINYGYLNRNALVTKIHDDIDVNDDDDDDNDEGVLMSNPDLDKYLPLSWRKVLNPVNHTNISRQTNVNYWTSEENGSGFSWVL